MILQNNFICLVKMSLCLLLGTRCIWISPSSFLILYATHRKKIKLKKKGNLWMQICKHQTIYCKAASSQALLFSLCSSALQSEIKLFHTWAQGLRFYKVAEIRLCKVYAFLKSINHQFNRSEITTIRNWNWVMDLVCWGVYLFLNNMSYI